MTRVLWFSNSPVSAGKVKNIDFAGGSWIKALEAAFRDKPEYRLGIVCQMRTETIEKHVIDDVDYFICPVTSGFVKRTIGWGGNYILHDEQAVINYLKVIDDFKPDIIQIFGSENNYGLIVPKTKVPVIIHFQGFISMCVKKYFSGIDYADLVKQTPSIKIIKGVTEINYFNYFKKLEQREATILSGATNFFGRTDWDRRIIRTQAPGARYFHCEEMLREAFFKEVWKNPADNTTLILSSILSAGPYKGFDLVYETATMLLKLGVKFTWNIIGCSDNEEIIRLLNRKYKKPFPREVKMLGSKNTSELISILQQSHMYIHPSYIDNSPNSVCEAMMLGMPVIVVATGGCPSLIKHKTDGLLVNAGDPFDMTGAIMELREDQVLAAKLGSNAKLRALERHDPSKIFETITNTYKTIIHDSK